MAAVGYEWCLARSDGELRALCQERLGRLLMQQGRATDAVATYEKGMGCVCVLAVLWNGGCA